MAQKPTLQWMEDISNMNYEYECFASCLNATMLAWLLIEYWVMFSILFRLDIK